ncbi:hypothetical protein N2152v2_002218 [Parachlorella kessleri]
MADLNGDGKPEIIVAAPDGNVKVLAPRRFGDGFAQALLLSELSIAEGREHVHIVGLASGHITPQHKELVYAPRKQVVVVVTNQLKVLCYDHNLRRLWEQDLQEHYPAGGTIRELALHISETSISQGDKGLVVVGASVTPLTLADQVAREDAVEKEEHLEELERSHADGSEGGAGQQAQQAQRDQVASRRRSLLALEGTAGDSTAAQKKGGEGEDHSEEGRHFSYFAFEGSKGELRWKHEAEDFVKDLAASREELVATHSYRLKAEQAEARHYGEHSCRAYRESVLGVLPHAWGSRLDTRLELARFEKQREGKGAQKEQLSKLGSSKGRTPPTPRERPEKGRKGTKAAGADNPVTDVLASVIRGAMHSGGKQGKTMGANVLVAHVEEGIEAVHLYSGRTVCRLHLPSPGLNADLNGDGVPDYIVARGGDPEELINLSHTGHQDAATAYCSAVAMSGVPPTLPLFNGSVCRPFGRGLSRSAEIGEVEVAQPIMLPIPGQRGHYRIGKVGQKGIAVFLNSRGDLTGYDAQGEMLWQASTPASWTPHELGEDEDVPHRFVTLKPVPLRSNAVPTVILAAGGYSAVIMSEHGHELDSLDLPELPAQPLVLADFNFDGYTDIILLGHEGIYGWAQVRRPGAVPFSALVGGLIVIMVGVFITQQGFMQQGGKRRGRSTDRVD